HRADLAAYAVRPADRLSAREPDRGPAGGALGDARPGHLRQLPARRPRVRVPPRNRTRRGAHHAVASAGSRLFPAAAIQAALGTQRALGRRGILSLLAHLQIRDFAIIDSAELELSGGLTALTGETGAGKSIIVDAVMLALGGRASADALRHGAERAEITATFDCAANPAVRRWLDEQSIEAEDGEVILRRVVGRDGRSRQYVNGQAQPAQSVRALGELLIDIHGQQEFQSLVSRDAQRGIVDAHGVNEKLAGDVAALAAEWRQCVAERDALAALVRDRGARLELLRYQVG